MTKEQRKELNLIYEHECIKDLLYLFSLIKF